MDYITSKKKLQNYIYLLNESSNKSKLKLNYSNDDEFNINDELNMFFELLTKTTFTTSRDVLHPNLISFLVDNNICEVKRELDGNKINCFLENKNKKRIYISKQIWFGYVFFEKFKKYKNKKFMKDFFDEDGYIQNLKMEEWVRTWNGVKHVRRLDFELDIGNDRKIVIEYLEDHHAEELINWNLYQSIRLVDILFGDKGDEIVHFAFIWDKFIDSNYIDKKVHLLVSKIKDFHNIDNEKKYTIGVLNEEIKNKKLSKILVEVFMNENVPNLDINKLDNLFGIKSEAKTNLIDRFITIADQLSNNINKNTTDSLLDSESESEDDNLKEEEKICFYQMKNEDFLLTNNGLFLYLDTISINDVNSKNKYMFKIRFINMIGKSAYSSAIKIRNLILNLKENIISGLDEIY